MRVVAWKFSSSRILFIEFFGFLIDGTIDGSDYFDDLESQVIEGTWE